MSDYQIQTENGVPVSIYVPDLEGSRPATAVEIDLYSRLEEANKLLMWIADSGMLSPRQRKPLQVFLGKQGVPYRKRRGEA